MMMMIMVRAGWLIPRRTTQDESIKFLAYNPVEDYKSEIIIGLFQQSIKSAISGVAVFPDYIELHVRE